MRLQSPSSIQGTASFSSSASLDNSLSGVYRAPPRPLPYDVDPRYIRLQRDGLVSRREKGSSRSQEEGDPLRGSDSDQDTDPLCAGSKWNNSTCDDGTKGSYTKSSFKASSPKEATGFAHILSPSEDEDVCPTCLEGKLMQLFVEMSCLVLLRILIIDCNFFCVFYICRIYYRKS